MTQGNAENDRQLLAAALERAHALAHVGTWVAEYTGDLRFLASAETARILGLEPHAIRYVRDVRERIHEADRATVRAMGEAARKAERPLDCEVRIVRPDGDIRWVHATGDVERDAGGTPIRMIGCMQDITDRRLLEDELRQAQKMDAIGRLAGGIAHDLNNALTAIAGYAELALTELPAGHTALNDVKEIRRAAERAASVTRQLLAFSRKQLLDPRPFDLNDTVEAIARLLDRLLGATVTVQTTLSSAPLPPILGDPGQVEQAIINLAVNARDAMPDGGTLTLTTSVEDLSAESAARTPPMAPGRYVLLQVADTGHGMSPDVCARMFEPFFTTKEQGKGTGLGLSMVYGTVKQVGGFVFARSAPGQGTTFLLYFPVAPSRLPVSADVPAQGDGELEPQREYTVLVAEDEPAVRQLVASTLKAEGCRLLLAGSAEEALRLAEAHGYAIDLLLTDAIMPGRSGIELAQQIAAVKPGVPVILMSGYTADTLQGRDERIDLLQKPFAPRELRRRVREALRQLPASSS